MTVLTLKLKSEHQSIPLYDVEVGTPDELIALPIMLFYPFVHDQLEQGEPLVKRLYEFRQQRSTAQESKTDEATLDQNNYDDNEYDDDEYEDYEDDLAEQIGILDLWDVEFLNKNAVLSILVSDALPKLRQWLNDLLASQPTWSALGETWWTLLLQQIKTSEGDVWFELDIGALFAQGQAFARVMYERFVNERYFWRDWHFSAEMILGIEPLSEGWQQFYQDMQLQIQQWGSTAVIDNEHAQFDDTEINILHQLRLDILHGRWDHLRNTIDPQNLQQQPLIRLGAMTAMHMADDQDAEKQIRLQRNQLWIDSGSSVLARQAFVDQDNWASTLRQNEDNLQAVELMELNLQQFPEAMSLVTMRRDFASMLLNLSYAYIKRVDTPRKAFDLLGPIVDIMDDDPDWQAIDGNTRAKIRANYQSAQIHMRAKGEEVPLFKYGLTTSEEDELDKKTDAMEKALNDKQPEQALAICNEAIQFLDDKGFAKNAYDQLFWRIDQARALRDLGQSAEAITSLTDIIELAQNTEHMHAKQLIPRATISLAICYKRQGHISEAQAIYENLLRSPIAREKNNTIASRMSSACNNLALIYSETGKFEDACNTFIKAQEYCAMGGQNRNGSEKLWFAFLEAKKARSWQLQHDALTKLKEDYQDCADSKVQERVKQATDALKIMGDSDWTEKNAFNRWLAKVFKMR